MPIWRCLRLNLIMIIVLIVLLVDFVIFKVQNSKFIKVYPEYEGSYLWSLLFFPIVYLINIILLEVAVIFTGIIFTFMSYDLEPNSPQILFRILRNWAFIFFFLCGGGIYLIIKSRKRLNKILFNWDNDKNNENEALKKMSIIVGIGITLPFLYFMTIYLSVSNNEWLWWYLSAIFGDEPMENAAFSALIIFILNIAVGYAIWYFSKKKLNSLSEILGVSYKSTNFQTFSAKPYTDNPDNSRDTIKDLRDLKQLFDEGVLTEEEFNELKKGVLVKGI